MVLLISIISSYFPNYSVSADLKTGIILPLFKGKSAKANNKDNYRGITMFPTLTKIYGPARQIRKLCGRECLFFELAIWIPGEGKLLGGFLHHFRIN